MPLAKNFIVTRRDSTGRGSVSGKVSSGGSENFFFLFFFLGLIQRVRPPAGGTSFRSFTFCRKIPSVIRHRSWGGNSSDD